ncbi:ester cyclase [Nonomuraea aurantiaca]|uniref:ester cyclase n=1 Tax=Nonomuraea aurantiaca TaxID=2878562 RepID=UPI001CDA3372|nr:ester cyclase [Nonomuraea aurantiaca]MCA2219846.1 ester cyclase [Nonomuraea aurantiaca]
MKDVIMRLYDEVLNQGRLDVADEIIAATLSTGPNDPPGPERVKQISTHIRSALPDMHFDIQDMIAEDNRVATRWTLRGTHAGPFFGVPPTNQPLEIRACVIFELKDNQITNLWPILDTSTLRPT